MNPNGQQRPLAVVTGASSGIGFELARVFAEVARQGFEALMAGREKVVGGSFKNKVQTVAGRAIPDSVKAETHRKMAQPATAGERGEKR